MIKKIINKSHSETEFSSEDNTEDNNLESTPTTTLIYSRLSIIQTFDNSKPSVIRSKYSVPWKPRGNSNKNNAFKYTW
jgi:hypothetical protein